MRTIFFIVKLHSATKKAGEKMKKPFRKRYPDFPIYFSAISTFISVVILVICMVLKYS